MMKTTLDHINAWSRMRKYYLALMSLNTSNMERRTQQKIWHERQRVIKWILDAEKEIKIQFIAMPIEDWGGYNGY